MNDTKAKAIAAQLLANATGLRYGSVSVSAKVHDGRVVEVTYSKTEQTREPAAERVLTSEGSPPVRGIKKDNEQ